MASLERVTLNGSEQWITIRGEDVDNPILLNLGMGGPGGGGFATRTQFEALEEHFTIVSWEEPGTGKSIHAVGLEELDRNRFVEDARALTELLLERFDEDGVFVYGVSWSSILGVWLVQEYPDLFHAFVSSGQMVNTTENDRLGYQLALDFSRERGDQRTVDRLVANGPPPYAGEAPVFRYLDYLDLAEQAARLEVPVHFFVGRNDVNAMASIVERYHERLAAPDKRLVWLEGGHGLGTADSTSQFFEVMVHELRPLAT